MSNIRLARTGAGLALVIGGLVGGVVGGVIGGVTVATALSRPAVANTTFYACLKDGLLSKVSVKMKHARRGTVSSIGTRLDQKARRAPPVFKVSRATHTTCRLARATCAQMAPS
jgi:hypothetical protein